MKNNIIYVDFFSKKKTIALQNSKLLFLHHLIIKITRFFSSKHYHKKNLTQIREKNHIS